MIQVSLRSEPFRYLIISAAMLFFGMLFYGFYNKLIIIRLPMTGRVLPLDHRYAHRRKTRLWYFNGERFIYEDKELIFSANTQATLTDLVASWLSLLDEENLLTKKITVQSIMLDPQKTTAFIAFDQNPFEKRFSTHTKLMFIEGLLRTLKESTIPLKKIQFLVQHAPLKDSHLDCVHPWTIEGYTD